MVVASPMAVTGARMRGSVAGPDGRVVVVWWGWWGRGGPPSAPGCGPGTPSPTRTPRTRRRGTPARRSPAPPTSAPPAQSSRAAQPPPPPCAAGHLCGGRGWRGRGRGGGRASPIALAGAARLCSRSLRLGLGRGRSSIIPPRRWAPGFSCALCNPAPAGAGASRRCGGRRHRRHAPSPSYNPRRRSRARPWTRVAPEERRSRRGVLLMTPGSSVCAGERRADGKRGQGADARDHAACRAEGNGQGQGPCVSVAQGLLQGL
jgi:hypothetical protein